MNWYNAKRLHSKIGYITPKGAEEEFYDALNATENAAEDQDQQGEVREVSKDDAHWLKVGSRGPNYHPRHASQAKLQFPRNCELCSNCSLVILVDVKKIKS